MGDTDERLQWALHIADLGFYVFPLLPGSKRPPKGSWTGRMTRDPDTIRQFFADTPDMNYGVCPGPGGAIIDLDEGKGKHGIAAYALIEGEQEVTDQIQGLTFEVESPSGGRHLYVTVDEPVSNSHGFGFGIDVRGAAGYVVGPGCYFDAEANGSPGDKSGSYKVLVNQPFRKAPKWQHNLFVDDELKRKPVEEIAELDLPSSIAQAKQFLQTRAVAVEGLNGDLHTFKTACILRRDYALSPETALDLLTDYEFMRPDDPAGPKPRSWNDRCDPPWEKYGAHDSLEEKVENAGRYAKHHQGEKVGALMLDGLDLSQIADVEKVRDEQLIQTRSEIEKDFLRGKEIFEILKPQSFVIPFWVLDSGIHACIGRRGIGKSTIAMDMALRLAHDMDWHGVEIRKGMKVLFACGEDERGAGSQIRAWCNFHNVKEPDPERFIFAKSIMDLADDDDVRAWAEAIRAAIGNKDTIVFVDTWQRAIANLKQNEDSDMQRAVKYVEAIGRSVNGPVVAIYHPPKGDEDTIAGSQVQRNTTVAEWFVKEEATGLKFYVDRIKAEGRGQHQLFKLKQVNVGVKADYFGFDLTHVVPVRIGGAIMGMDGAIHKDEDMTRVARALCETMRDLENHRADETSYDKGYSTKQMAHAIVGQEGVGGGVPLIRREDEWCKAATAKMIEAGLVFPMKSEILQALIEKTLNAHPGGYDLGNGTCLKLQSMGRSGWRIILESGGVGL